MLDQRVTGPESAAQSASPASIAPYCILFFISGFPALIYQIVWQRSLFTIYGVNIESVTMIVTIFMLGLGLGSLAGGRLSTIRALPIPIVFGVIEIGIGLFGVASLAVFHRVALWTAGASTARTGLITAGLLLLPTLLMGSTLPLLVTHVLRINRNVGESVGLLYAVNTLGSAAACLIAALFAMRLLGQSGSIRMAAALNFIVGCSALLLRRSEISWEAVAELDPPDNEPPASRVLPFSLAVILAASTGFIALGYEIVWYRLYSFASGGTAFSFALLLAFYLGGIAFGSLFVHDFCRERLSHDSSRSLGILGNLMIWAAIASMLVGPVLAVAVRHMNLLATFPLVFVGAALLGAAFPLLAHASIGPTGQAGSRLSYLYLANIVGSASGSFIAGFILMDIWSIRQISVGLLFVALIPGAFLLVHSGRKARLLGSFGFCVAVLIALFSPPLFSNLYLNLLLKRENAGTTFRHLVETRSGVISVSQDGVVYGGGAYDGRFNTDLNHDTNGIFRAFAIVDLHPHPAEVLVIGLSSGSWAQIIANDSRVRDVNAVEINPGYLRLIPLYPVVSGLLQNPKVHITIDDGRRWLVSNPDRRFDLIVMNTTYHWRANASNLLSAEFLRLARRHLRTGGILYYNTTGSDEALLTGATVFPYSLRVWNFLAVSDSPILVDKHRWEEQLSRYTIEGKPIFDLNDAAQRKRLRDVLSLADSIYSPDQPQERGMESGESLRQRLQGLRLITDDNMGREW
jgi:spermidine synthase